MVNSKKTQMLKSIIREGSIKYDFQAHTYLAYRAHWGLLLPKIMW